MGVRLDYLSQAQMLDGTYSLFMFVWRFGRIFDGRIRRIFTLIAPKVHPCWRLNLPGVGLAPFTCVAAISMSPWDLKLSSSCCSLHAMLSQVP